MSSSVTAAGVGEARREWQEPCCAHGSADAFGHSGLPADTDLPRCEAQSDW